MSAPSEATKAFWAKCPTCGHCWAAAYYPMELARIAKIIGRAVCPKGCKSTPTVAKQNDGVLQEGQAA